MESSDLEFFYLKKHKRLYRKYLQKISLGANTSQMTKKFIEKSNQLRSDYLRESSDLFKLLINEIDSCQENIDIQVSKGLKRKSNDELKNEGKIPSKKRKAQSALYDIYI